MSIKTFPFKLIYIYTGWISITQQSFTRPKPYQNYPNLFLLSGFTLKYKINPAFWGFEGFLPNNDKKNTKTCTLKL